MPIVVEQFVLELDTTIKIGGGGACFTIGGTRQVPIVVETLVFDEGQITCPTNGLNPQWGGCCHALSGNAGRTIVIIREEEDEQHKT